MNQSQKSPVEVLISLRKTPEVASGDVHMSQRLAFDLLSLQSEGYDGKKILEVIAKKTLHEIAEPTHTNMHDILLCFGAGGSVLNTETKTVTMHSHITQSSEPVDKEKTMSFSQAKQIVQPIYFLQVYLDIISDHLATDQRPEDILKRIKGIQSDIQHRTWQEIEETALKTLFASPALKLVFPELADQTITEQEKRLFLTHSFVRHGKFRVILARNLLQIKEELQNLPAVELYEEEELLVKRKEEERKRQYHEINVIINYIQQYVPHIHATDMIKLQEFLREQDITQASLRTEIEQIVAHSYGISSVMLKDLKDKKRIEQDVTALERQLQDPSLVGTPDQEVHTLKEQLQSQRTELQTRYSDEELDSHRQDLDQIEDLFEKDKTEDHPEGFLIQKIQKIISYQDNIKAYDRELQETQSKDTKSSTKQLRTRLQEEAKQIDQLATVVDKSILQFMIGQYDNVTIALQQRMEAMDEEREKQLVLAHSHAQDEANKEFFLNPLEQQEMRDLHAISGFLQSRWIQYDIRTRQHTVHGGNIKNDLLTLLYQGADGLRSIVQHAVGIPDAEELSTVDKKRIDAIIRMKGSAIKRKLLRDFFMSRMLSPSDSPFSGSISSSVRLREHEWELFTQVFEDDIQETIQSSQEAKRLVYLFEGKGIVPHAKIQWLIVCLILLKAGFVGHYAQPLLLGQANPKHTEQPVLKQIDKDT
jgi:DTW domain-containing protein YfiP